MYVFLGGRNWKGKECIYSIMESREGSRKGKSLVPQWMTAKEQTLNGWSALILPYLRMQIASVVSEKFVTSFF